MSASLQTPTDRKVQILQRVCDEHLKRVLQFRLTVLMAALAFAPDAASRLAHRLLFHAFCRRAMRDLVGALMPVLDETLDPTMYCTDDTRWNKTLTHVVSKSAPTEPVPLEALAGVARRVDALTERLWDTSQ